MKSSLVAAVVIGLTSGVWSLQAAAENHWNRDHFLGSWRGDVEATHLVSAARKDPRVISKLANERTDAARAALLRIAYGELGEGPSAAYASGLYVASLENKTDARALLVATNFDVVVTGVRAILGQPIDPELMSMVQRLMRCDSARVRGLTAKLIRLDTNKDTAVEKAEAIARSMATTSGCVDANDPVATGELWFDHYWRQAELSLAEQAYALVKIESVPADFISDLEWNEAALAEEFLSIARAACGDTAARPKLSNILLDSESPLARMMSLSVLRIDPDSGELAAIERMAQYDRFQAKPNARYAEVETRKRVETETSGGLVYALRVMARQALEDLESDPSLTVRPESVDKPGEAEPRE